MNKNGNNEPCTAAVQPAACFQQTETATLAASLTLCSSLSTK